MNDKFCTSQYLYVQPVSLCSSLPLLGFSCTHLFAVFIGYTITQLQGDCKVIHRVKWLYCRNLLPVFFPPNVTVTKTCTSCKIRHTIFCASRLCLAWQPLSWQVEWVLGTNRMARVMSDSHSISFMFHGLMSWQSRFQTLHISSSPLRKDMSC